MEVTLLYQHSHSTLHTLALCSTNTHTPHFIHSQFVLPTLTHHTSYTRSLFYPHSHTTLHTLAVCSTHTHTAHFIHLQFVLPTLTRHTSYTRSLFYQHSHTTLHTLAVCSTNTHMPHFIHSQFVLPTLTRYTSYSSYIPQKYFDEIGILLKLCYHVNKFHNCMLTIVLVYFLEPTLMHTSI